MAAGSDPASDPALATRAERLARPATRRAIATTFHNLLDAAEEPPGSWRRGDPRPPLRRRAVLAARPYLLALGERLTDREPIPVRAVALAAQLAWDSASPMYAATRTASVAEFAQGALELASYEAAGLSSSSASPSQSISRQRSGIWSRSATIPKSMWPM